MQALDPQLDLGRFFHGLGCVRRERAVPSPRVGKVAFLERWCASGAPR